MSQGCRLAEQALYVRALRSSPAATIQRTGREALGGEHPCGIAGCTLLGFFHAKLGNGTVLVERCAVHGVEASGMLCVYGWARGIV